jgi:rhamnosyltransferase subunit B
MRALIIAFGSYGDVLPMIAIGAELRRRGHEVVLASAEPFAGMALRAGLEFEALATIDEYDEMANSSDLWRPLVGVRRLFAFAGLGLRRGFDFVERRRKLRQTVVVGNSLALGARLAHDVFGTPHVSVHMTAALMQSRVDPPRLAHLPSLDWLPKRLLWNVQMGVDERFIDPVVVPGVNAVRAEFGLPPIARLRYWWNSPSRSLLMVPDWFVAPQPEWPPQMRQCSFPQADAYGARSEGLDPEARAFLEAEGPVAAVTFGSMMPGAEQLYRSAIEACVRAKLRPFVMTSTALNLPPELARMTFVTRYAPLREVASRSAVGVHHGGVGTISRFLAEGVPQLITPMAFDQFDNAERARRLGCAVVVGRRWFRSGTAAAKLVGLLKSSATADACRRAAPRAQTDGVGEACDYIEGEFARVVRIRIERRAQKSGEPSQVVAP